MNKKGFTLVELLMVVIIIGILVTLAIPNYYRSIERAKAGKAKAALDSIRKSQLQYRAYSDDFALDLTDLVDFELPAGLSDQSDGDWIYDMTADGTDLTLTAERVAGVNSAEEIYMDQDGVMTTSATILEWGIR